MPVWTSDEEQRLRSLISEGGTLNDISTILQHGRDAVYMKIHRLGLSTPKNFPKKPRVGADAT